MNVQDPIAVAKAMDETWNAHDVDGAVSFFTEDAIVRIVPPVKPDKEVLVGWQEIREWAEDFMEEGFHVESSNYSAADNAVSWDSEVHLDRFEQMGMDQIHFSAEAVLEGSKFKWFIARMDEEAARQLQQVMAFPQKGG